MRPRTLLLAVLLAGALPRPAGAGRWWTLAAMPAARSEVASATTAGVVYSCGGFLSSFQPTPLCDTYDTATDTWSAAMADLPAAWDHGKMVALGGRLYFIGGGIVIRGVWSDQVYEYDIGADRWRTVAPMPTARWAPGAAAWAGKVYVAGGLGRTGEDVLPLLEFTPPDPADPSDLGRWRELAARLPLVNNHLNVEVLAGRLYVFGGRDLANVNLADTYFYDLADSPVSGPHPRTPMPTARSGFESAAVNGRVHTLGGEQPGGVFDSHEVFDPQGAGGGGVWTTETAMPTARTGLTVDAWAEVLYATAGSAAGQPAMTLNEAWWVGPITGGTPTLTVTGGRIVCAGENARLDASGAAFGLCPPAERRVVWEDGDGNVVALGALLDHGPLAAGTHGFRVVAWCATQPNNLSRQVETVTALPDPLPGPLGNVLYAVRPPGASGDDVELVWSWTGGAVSGFAVHQVDGTGPDPVPAVWDASPEVARSGAGLAAATLAGLVPAAPPLALLRVRALSPCAGTPGPP